MNATKRKTCPVCRTKSLGQVRTRYFVLLIVIQTFHNFQNKMQARLCRLSTIFWENRNLNEVEPGGKCQSSCKTVDGRAGAYHTNEYTTKSEKIHLCYDQGFPWDWVRHAGTRDQTRLCGLAYFFQTNESMESCITNRATKLDQIIFPVHFTIIL